VLQCKQDSGLPVVLLSYIPFMKQQFVVTDRYTVLQETKKFDRSFVDQH
jgi:hypothetical protein